MGDSSIPLPGEKEYFSIPLPGEEYFSTANLCVFERSNFLRDRKN